MIRYNLLICKKAQIESDLKNRLTDNERQRFFNMLVNTNTNEIIDTIAVDNYNYKRCRMEKNRTACMVFKSEVSLHCWMWDIKGKSNNRFNNQKRNIRWQYS